MCSSSLMPMSRIAPRGTLMVLAAVLLVAISAQAAEKNKPASPSDDTAIRATADAFVQAFNRGDARAVAALWTEKGTMADDRGQIFKGRKAIEAEYVALFKEHPGAKMEVAIQSIDFATPGMAIEDGVARVVAKDGPPAASRYTAVHVLEGGKWLMASVRESRIEIPSNFPRMQQFGWLVGKWEAKSEHVSVRTEVRWIANRSFLQREYTVRQDGLVTSSGVQIIGWDPLAGQVRSWSFDSAGGHGTGLWTATPDGWQIESTGVLPDGTSSSSRDFLVRIRGEQNIFGWYSVNRKIGAMELPNTREIVLDRVPEKK
jgi:uncharacterized protein (TIGR02246 family)